MGNKYMGAGLEEVESGSYFTAHSRATHSVSGWQDVLAESYGLLWKLVGNRVVNIGICSTMGITAEEAVQAGFCWSIASFTEVVPLKIDGVVFGELSIAEKLPKNPHDSLRWIANNSGKVKRVNALVGKLSVVFTDGSEVKIDSRDVAEFWLQSNFGSKYNR